MLEGELTLKRIDALRALAGSVTEEDLFVSSLGALCDDWWNLRPGKADNTFSPNVLGAVTPIALGLALALPHRRVFALETDGSILMNLGTFCVIAAEHPSNLIVVVLDNGEYECTGGHRTFTSGASSLRDIAAGCGCRAATEVRDPSKLAEAIDSTVRSAEPLIVIARIVPGTHEWAEEQRKWTDGVEDKYRFLRYIEKLEGKRIHSGARQK